MRFYILLFVCLFSFLSLQNNSYAGGYRKKKSKSCIKKVILPGHKKPVKARKVKYAYFN